MLARGINRPPNFKATCNRGVDPPNFRLLNEEKVNQRPNDMVHIEAINPSQAAQRLCSNHATNQTSDSTEDRLLGTITMLEDDHINQANISQVALDSHHTLQSIHSTTRLHLILEHRQREIRTMICLEEIKRLNLSMLLSNYRNVILNPTLRQNSTEYVLPKKQIDLSTCAMVLKENPPFWH